MIPDPLAHEPEMMPLMLKNMVLWGCVFLTGNALLLCFVVDVYGAEQREDYFPV